MNITVEALDDLHTHMYRNWTLSQDSASDSDSFHIITGQGWKYGGVDSHGGPDPYGTEYAGLPGKAGLTVYAWVAGYNLVLNSRVQHVDVSCPTTNFGCQDAPQSHADSSPSLSMIWGGAIRGVLRFNFCADPCEVGFQNLTPETPLLAEQNRTAGTHTQELYGGNIVVEAFDGTDTLRGITLINGTRADGKTIYSNLTEVPFVIFGFSEFLNRSLTWAGAEAALSGVPSDACQTQFDGCFPACYNPSPDGFCWKDAALPLSAGTDYELRVFIRGYTVLPCLHCSSGTVPVTVRGDGQLTNLTLSPIEMVEGGTVQVSVYSYDNIPGTLIPQALIPWRFLNLPIPVTARVYFYDNNSNTLGYVERLMVTTGPNAVQLNSFKVNFAGQDWSIRDILFLAQKPNYVPNSTNLVSAFTLGYVQQFPGKLSTSNVALGTLTRKAIVLFAGNEIDLSVPIFVEPSCGSGCVEDVVPENQHILAEVTTQTGQPLAGAMLLNATKGLEPLLDFPLFGFGAMSLNESRIFRLVGQGHFFYVPKDGIVEPQCQSTYYGFPFLDANRCFDYGFGKDIAFTVNVPEYGFQYHYTPYNTTLPQVIFNDLFLGQGTYIFSYRMAELMQGTDMQKGLILGEACDGPPVPLSWAQVTASGQPPTTTYDGDFMLFVRGELAYSLEFSYEHQFVIVPTGTLGWGSVTPEGVTPLSTPTCDPPASGPTISANVGSRATPGFHEALRAILYSLYWSPVVNQPRVPVVSISHPRSVKRDFGVCDAGSIAKNIHWKSKA